jgi:hypothetical protein
MLYVGWVLEAIVIALFAGMGIGVGEQLYVTHPAFANESVLTFPWRELWGYGLLGVLRYLPLEILVVVSWTSVKTLGAVKGQIPVLFTWYYLPLAYAFGMVAGVALASTGTSHNVSV